MTERMLSAGDLHGRPCRREGHPDLPGDETAEVLQHQHRPSLRHEGRALRLRLFPQLHAAALRGVTEQQTSRLAEPLALLHHPAGHQHSQQGHCLQVSHLLKVSRNYKKKSVNLISLPSQAVS